jgi:PAS domain S-box-containing protein
MLIIAGYNLILFFSLHDLAYLFLSIVILGFAASKAANDGMGHAYVWPQFSNRWTIESSILVTMLAAGLFTTSFLELRHRAPKLHRTFLLLGGVLVLALLLVPFVNTIPIVLVLLGVELVLILSASGYAWRKGYRPARLFLLAWFFPLAATLTFVLYHFGKLPYEFFSSNLLLGFLAMLALLWSLALADRIRLIQTQAQTAEKNLASTENRYRSLFQDSNDAVFIAARTGEILDLNPAGLNMFGYTRAELETLRVPDLFRMPAEYSQWQRLLEQDGFVAEYEALMRARDGTALTIVISSTRWRDEQTGLAGYQGILRDVTERRRTQQELDTHRLHLEEMVAARTAQARAELAERERAELALERRIRELSALNEIARTISTVTDLAPALQTVTASIRNLFQMDAAAIYAFHSADRTLSCLASDPPNTLKEELMGPVRVRATIPLLDHSPETVTPRALRADKEPHLFQAACAFLPPLPYAALAFVPLRAGGILNGILLFGATRSDAFPENANWDLVETIGGTIATAIENARMFEQAQSTAVAGERQRLARELHDSVTQLLYSIVLLAGGWSMETAQGELRHAQLETYFDELADLGQQALGEMRLLLYQLRSSVLSQVGLSGALKHRLNAVEERVGIQTKFHTTGEVDSLPLHLQAEVYFIAQEALNNALRHAHASAVQIELTRRNSRLELVVQDNGNGFDPNIVTEGMGLQNMSTRAQLLGAEFQVISNHGDGTRIRLCLEMMPEVEG